MKPYSRINLQQYIKLLFKSEPFDYATFYQNLPKGLHTSIVEFLAQSLNVTTITIRAWGNNREFVPDDKKPLLEAALGFNKGELFPELFSVKN